MELYTRWQAQKINEALKTRRVLVLSGTRQCGKTTLAKNLSIPPNIYRNLDDANLLESAKTDPHDFVKHDDNLMVIDEIQKAPALIPAIKMDVDINLAPGRFLLTGSADIQSLPTVTESLAGRVSHIRLRPLTQGEIEGSTSHFLQRAFHNEFSQNITFNYPYKSSFKEDYIKFALAGGYPEPLLFEKDREHRKWFIDYIDAIIKRDLKDITHIKRTDEMHKLITIMAGWSSRFIDLTKISAGLTLTMPTLSTYINALEILFVIDRVPQWTRTVYENIGKRDKLLMNDTGMMSALLGWSFDKVRLDGACNGMLLETFVFTQLSSLLDCQEECYKLSHYRDNKKREIDFIVENEEGSILGIEVKAGTNVCSDDFKHLIWFKQNLALNRSFFGVILYSGSHCLPFGDGLWAVPIHALWQ